MEIKRKIQPPRNLPGLWVDVEGVGLYHLLSDDNAEMAVKIRKAMEGKDLQIEPWVEVDPVAQQIDALNLELENFGVDARVTDPDQIEGASIYLNRLRQARDDEKVGAFLASTGG